MPTLELTDRFCAAAKAEAGSQTDFYDEVVKGLVLRASPGGTRAFYLVYSRPGDRRRTRLKLGVYPSMPLGGPKGARQAARNARAAIDHGADPRAEERAQRAAMTVADLIEAYAARHASTRRSGVETTRILRANLIPMIGALKLADLHRRDVQRCIDAVRDRGAPIAANRLFAHTRAMLRWAHARGDLDSNIVEAMRQPSPTPDARERVLSTVELAAMWSALRDCTHMRESTKRVLRLCLATGQRVGEVAGMTRAEIDLDREIWTIPGGRAKNGREHTVPLSEFALAMLREQIAYVDALSKRKRRPVPAFVFPAPGGRTSMSAAAVAHALRDTRVEADSGATILGVAAFTAHDLRRTAATHMEESGISPHVIGHVLNHVSATKATVTSKVYARYDYSKEKRAALDLWAARLSGIINGGAHVVPLRREA